MQVKYTTYGDPQKLKKRRDLIQKLKFNSQKDWADLSADEKDDFMSFLYDLYKEKIK